MSAATYLNTALINEMEHEADSYLSIAEMLMGVLEDVNISDRCKPPLQRALTGIVDATCNSTVSGETQKLPSG